MIVDIVQSVVDCGVLKANITLCQLNKYTYENIYIYYTHNKDYDYFEMDQDIMKQKKFSRIKKLCMSDNDNIYNVNHLSGTLTSLDCSDQCGINQNGISQLKNINALNIYNNKYIYDIIFLNKNLKKLTCSEIINPQQKVTSKIDTIFNSIHDCQVGVHAAPQSYTQGQLSKLDGLSELTIEDCYECVQIPNLADTLTYLNCTCSHIHNIGVLKLLTHLDCSHCEYITQYDIEQLKFLKILNMNYADNICDLGHLSDTLKELHCSANTSVYSKNKMSQKGIEKLFKLVHIECNDNTHIHNVNHMKNLETLECTGKSGVNQEGIANLAHLKYLDCSFNPHIIDVNHMASTLERLECQGDNCGIGQKGIENLLRLKHIECQHNSKITDIDIFVLEKCNTRQWIM